MKNRKPIMRALAAPLREPLQLADYDAKANSADVRADAPPLFVLLLRATNPNQTNPPKAPLLNALADALGMQKKLTHERSNRFWNLFLNRFVDRTVDHYS